MASATDSSSCGKKGGFVSGNSSAREEKTNSFGCRSSPRGFLRYGGMETRELNESADLGGIDSESRCYCAPWCSSSDLARQKARNFEWC